MAKELATRAITVNAVAPGFIETDMTGTLPEEVKTGYLSLIPAGRCGKPRKKLQRLWRFWLARLRATSPAK